jgi:uncharacterized protein (TIGR03067 family)
MMRVVVSAVLLLCGAFATAEDKKADPPSKDAKKELATLQGEWEAVRGEQNGSVVEWRDGEKRFLLEKNKLFVFHPQTGKKIEWLTITIDPDTSPKCIDLAGKGKGAMEGIYRLSGDTWTVCFDRDVKTVKARPTAFSTKESPSLVILTLKRIKK